MKKNRFIRSAIIAVLGMGVTAYSGTASAASKSIKYTKHNLSNWGQYSVKASGTTLKDTEVCIFCHAPHNADSTQVPLWNRNDTAVTTFTMATTHNVNQSKTYFDTQPSNTSKKCLSCHDGSIAIGEVRNGGPFSMTDSGSGKLDGDGSLKGYADGNPFGGPNYDLRRGHVISFKYKAAIDDFDGPRTRFNDLAASDANSMLDKEGRMQCHTCHDPHTDRCNDSNKTIGKDPFWRKACDGSGRNSSVCDTCHKVFAEYTAPNLKF